MKILFIQLPFLDHNYDYAPGNIDYSPASMAGFIKKEFGNEYELERLPFIISYFCSDRVIVEYILKSAPDIVAFTCYAWNVERNLKIAHAVKNLHDTIIFFGGPEINNGSFSLVHTHVFIDYFITGEGEWFFRKYLSGENIDKYGSCINGNRVIVQPEQELVDIRDLVEPFSHRYLNAMVDGSVFFELTRGCPYRCTYCLYSKNFNTIREHPFDDLINVIGSQYTRDNINEIYILSPSLNATVNFKEKLIKLAESNYSIQLHSEMRASGIDRETAHLLFSAGFRSMEIGLQTLNKEVLKRIGRYSNIEKELEGMENLKDAGIDLKIGIIPGLPGEDPDSFINTVDRLIDLGFSEFIELYPLMILPGTVMREHAVRDKILFLEKPPYYYLDGWGTSFTDVQEISSYVENRTGYTNIVKKLPDFSTSESGLYIRGVKVNGDEIKNWNEDKYSHFIETNVFTFYIFVTVKENIYKGLPLLMDGLPESELFNIVLYFNEVLDEQEIINLLHDHVGDNFFQRVNIFNSWPERIPLRFFQIIERPEIYSDALLKYSIIEPVFRLTHKNYRFLDNNYAVENVLVSKNIFNSVKDYLIGNNEILDDIAFEDETEYVKFCNLTGRDYIHFPFSLSVIDCR